ncbi:MAG: polysaccharide pyruvyl transferase family protein [Muribaculaceae bacterium]|nr:polysaccharide pyruvyl transferase family protein [Muribaculaceae bacterium]
MNSRKKIIELRNIISDQLSPLITGDYILMDAPYYRNVGDVLIWEGIHDFCRTLPGKNLGTSNITTCLFPKLSPEVTILLMGGGNFGDLWRIFQDFRLEVIQRYPQNRIVMFPQSVWYENQDLIRKDAEIFAKHPDVHLCGRDRYSYDFFSEHFKDCNVHLIPDMAFFINPDTLKKYRRPTTPRKLYLKRMDKELVEDTVVSDAEMEYEIHDWPSFEKRDKGLEILQPFLSVAYRTRKLPILRRTTAFVADSVADKEVRKRMVKKGIEFLSPYSEIITTRLHTLILGVLLDIPIRIIDNSTGKLSAFANTWLSDVDKVSRFGTF